MPRITVYNGPIFEAPSGKRLVLALEDAGVDILHRCGGFARCTTCRVRFYEGEPERMTVAEFNRLEGNAELFGKVRLSCQIQVTHDMTVEPLKKLAGSGLDGRGERPASSITPEAIWMNVPRK